MCNFQSLSRLFLYVFNIQFIAAAKYLQFTARRILIVDIISKTYGNPTDLLILLFYLIDDETSIN